MRSGGFDEPSVDFDYEALDDPGHDPEELARQRSAYAIAWMLTYVYTPEDAPLSDAFRRFVTLTYVVRPDLLDGRTMRSLSEEMGVPRSTFSDWVQKTRDEIGVEGVLSKDVGPRTIEEIREAVEREVSS